MKAMTSSPNATPMTMPSVNAITGAPLPVTIACNSSWRAGRTVRSMRPNVAHPRAAQPYGSRARADVCSGERGFEPLITLLTGLPLETVRLACRELGFVTPQRKVLVGVLITVAAIAGVVAANAIARPGCSLIPVELASEPSRSSVGTPAQACAVLGQPLPEARTLPAGVTRGEIGIDPPSPIRGVSVSYVMAGKGIGILQIRRGDIPQANRGEINTTVAGAPAIVAPLTASSASGNQIVSYVWSRDGLFFAFHMALDNISRQDADRMADSVR
jgi:hypothetical protein